MTFNNRIALVTGGGRGIGEAISRQLLKGGAEVIIAQRTPHEVDGADFIQADLAATDDCQRVISETIRSYHRLDILVNNAGIMLEETVENLPLDQWEQTLSVNLRAPFLLIKYAIPHLRVNGGSIVNVGSIEGLGSNPGHAAYCASKAGLHALTRAVAVDHGQDNIRCNAVAPGWIDTELNENFIRSMPDPDGFRANIGKIHPLGRSGTPDEVAAMVSWLASDESSFVTGQIFTVDGGRMAKLSLPG